MKIPLRLLRDRTVIFSTVRTGGPLFGHPSSDLRSDYWAVLEFLRYRLPANMSHPSIILIHPSFIHLNSPFTITTLPSHVDASLLGLENLEWHILWTAQRKGGQEGGVSLMLDLLLSVSGEHGAQKKCKQVCMAEQKAKDLKVHFSLWLVIAATGLVSQWIMS